MNHSYLIDIVIDDLIEEYEKAKRYGYVINNPIAYALYQVWKSTIIRKYSTCAISVKITKRGYGNADSTIWRADMSDVRKDVCMSLHINVGVSEELQKGSVGFLLMGLYAETQQNG